MRWYDDSPIKRTHSNSFFGPIYEITTYDMDNEYLTVKTRSGNGEYKFNVATNYWELIDKDPGILFPRFLTQANVVSYLYLGKDIKYESRS